MNQDATVNAGDIARLVDVGRAAVSNWRRRHDDFPHPVGGTAASPLFSLREVEEWLRRNGKHVEVSLADRTWQRLRAAGDDLHLADRVASAGAQLLAAHDQALERGWLAALPTRLADAELAGLVRELGSELGAREAFEFLVERYLEAHSRRVSTTTPDIATLMTTLVAQPGGTILDPACGLGTLLLAAPADTTAIGQDLDPTTAAIAAIRLALADRAAITEIGDSLRADGLTTRATTAQTGGAQAIAAEGGIGQAAYGRAVAAHAAAGQGNAGQAAAQASAAQASAAQASAAQASAAQGNAGQAGTEQGTSGQAIAGGQARGAQAGTAEGTAGQAAAARAAAAQAAAAQAAAGQAGATQDDAGQGAAAHATAGQATAGRAGAAQVGSALVAAGLAITAESGAASATAAPASAMQADAVVCDPPFNERAWGYQELTSDPRWEYGLPPRGESELAWLQHCLAHAKPGGQVAILLPAAVAARRPGKRIRGNLLRAGALRAIVSLGPTGPDLWLLRRPEPGDRPPSHLLLLTAHDTLAGVEHAWRRHLADPAGGTRIIDLLDDDIDLSPVRHQRAGSTEDMLRDLRAATRLLAGTGITPPELTIPDHQPTLRFTTMGELVRAGALTVRQAPARMPTGIGDVTVLTADDLAAHREPTGRTEADPGLVDLRAGDVVASVLGGATRVMATSAVLGPYLTRYRVDPEQLDPDFLAGAIRAAEPVAHGGSSRTDVRRIRVPRLPLAAQREYAAAFRRLVDVEDTVRTAASAGERLVRLGFACLVAGHAVPTGGED